MWIEKTLRVSGMMCGHCSAAVEGALKALGGVISDVRLAEKEVRVRFEADRVRLEEIVSAIEEQGFDVARD